MAQLYHTVVQLSSKQFLRWGPGVVAASEVRTDLIDDHQDITLLAYAALRVEARRPGTVPQELLESLGSKVTASGLSTDGFPKLEGESIEYIDEVEWLLNQDTDLGKLVAHSRVRKLIENRHITLVDIEETDGLIEHDIETFTKLIENGGER